MGGLGNIFEVLGAEPLARWLALALALRAAWTLARWRGAAGRAEATGPVLSAEAAAAIEARRAAPLRHSARFHAVMVLGIGLALAGLFTLAARGDEAPGALALLLVGMYLFLTEPVRANIADARDRLALTRRAGDPQATAYALTLLRAARRDLALIEVAGAAALGLAVLALADDFSMRVPMPL